MYPAATPHVYPAGQGAQSPPSVAAAASWPAPVVSLARAAQQRSRRRPADPAERAQAMTHDGEGANALHKSLEDRLESLNSMSVVAVLLAGIAIQAFVSVDLAAAALDDNRILYAAYVAWALCASLSLLALMAFTFIIFAVRRRKSMVRGDAGAQQLMSLLWPVRSFVSEVFNVSVPFALVALLLTCLDRVRGPLGIALAAIFGASCLGIMVVYRIVRVGPHAVRHPRTRLLMWHTCVRVCVQIAQRKTDPIELEMSHSLTRAASIATAAPTPSAA
jgi:hypothetical protein